LHRITAQRTRVRGVLGGPAAHRKAGRRIRARAAGPADRRLSEALDRQRVRDRTDDDEQRRRRSHPARAVSAALEIAIEEADPWSLMAPTTTSTASRPPNSTTSSMKSSKASGATPGSSCPTGTPSRAPGRPPTAVSTWSCPVRSDRGVRTWSTRCEPARSTNPWSTTISAECCTSPTASARSASRTTGLPICLRRTAPHARNRCPGWRRRECGADRNWIPGWENRTPLDAATRNGAAVLVDWLCSRGAVTAAELR
jgi:hypothetical protein